MKVYNKSSLRVENAEFKKCPRCDGFGSIFKEDKPCSICNGHGKAWISPSGWTRAKYRNLENSKLY